MLLSPLCSHFCLFFTREKIIMTIELPKLPYAMNALQPYISEETVQYHYGKHHQAYVNKLNSLIPHTEFENINLEQIIRQSSGAIFNNAAQIWNHTFYWHSMKPHGGGEPIGDVASAINRSFGSFARFKEKLSAAAIGQFGSGWVWLVKTPAGELDVVSTGNGGTPMTDGKKPLLTCDVWEHAYYIDTRNDRAKYVENFWRLVNWDFVAKNYSDK